jgi:hypothetical protein
MDNPCPEAHQLHLQVIISLVGQLGLSFRAFAPQLVTFFEVLKFKSPRVRLGLLKAAYQIFLLSLFKFLYASNLVISFGCKHFGNNSFSTSRELY